MTTRETLLSIIAERGTLRLYAVEFANNRYSVYYAKPDGSGEIEVLWPSDSHEGKKAKDVPPGLKYSGVKKYPAWHFYLPGYGFARTDEIRQLIACWLGVEPYGVVCVETLRGASPSSY